jgi:hypothetical protein
MDGLVFPLPVKMGGKNTKLNALARGESGQAPGAEESNLISTYLLSPRPNGERGQG